MANSNDPGLSELHRNLHTIVRHCQTNLNGTVKGAGLRLSGRQLTPLGQGGRTVLFEDVAVVAVMWHTTRKHSLAAQLLR